MVIPRIAINRVNDSVRDTPVAMDHSKEGKVEISYVTTFKINGQISLIKTVTGPKRDKVQYELQTIGHSPDNTTEISTKIVVNEHVFLSMVKIIQEGE